MSSYNSMDADTAVCINYMIKLQTLGSPLPNLRCALLMCLCDSSSGGSSASLSGRNKFAICQTEMRNCKRRTQRERDRESESEKERERERHDSALLHPWMALKSSERTEPQRIVIHRDHLCKTREHIYVQLDFTFART